jgi:hypothetical protein
MEQNPNYRADIDGLRAGASEYLARQLLARMVTGSVGD